ncbi:glycosyltransferase family 4 protein [Flaviflexus equikiangi]|uniref:Glycosyltransferase family 4 protein n=1 Tax=Flaviflexus equikiangi TaxID=2758573 RepID=A0ABS2TFH0_9ACTO|nr:glycosyltransferase family 4 protein [Flaviflexus equikiangi]MBM9433404.1 glycosyltransferase family 4 protein [Flaviflexus equikiangi]
MKIGMLSQWYDPETGPAALPGVYAREFVRQGHEVSVLTGFPTYPEGKLYPGYSMRVREQEFGPSHTVTRVPVFPSHSRSSVGRVLNYTSFSLSATLLAGRPMKNVDALWVYNSPVTVALPMLWHSSLGKTPIFLHVQDLWPDSLIESGMFTDGRVADFTSRLISSLVRLTERRSAVVGVISESVRDLILERHPGIEPAKIKYVPNPTNEDLFRPSRLIRQEFGIELPDDETRVMYAGAIGDVQGLETLLHTAFELRQRDDIKFVLVGDGIRKRDLEIKSEEMGLKNIDFVGRVPQSEIPILMAQCHIHLVSLATSPFLRYTTPSKIPSLLASEVPIVAQIDGDGRRMIERSGAGIVATPGDPVALAAAVLSLAERTSSERLAMAKRGRSFYEENLSAEAASSKIVSSIMEGSGS